MYTKLTLRDKMKRTRLIQRLNKPIGRTSPFSFGGGIEDGGFSKNVMDILKNICLFDYMGSSEFEWGAVPEAFRFIADQKKDNNLVTGETDSIFYICPSQYEKNVKNIIKKLLKNEYSLNLKERCGLKDYFSKKEDNFYKNTVGWIEIDNGFMFFVDKDMFNDMKKLYNIE